jgi:hypothetical protein
MNNNLIRSAALIVFGKHSEAAEIAISWLESFCLNFDTVSPTTVFRWEVTDNLYRFFEVIFDVFIFSNLSKEEKIVLNKFINQCGKRSVNNVMTVFF